VRFDLAYPLFAVIALVPRHHSILKGVGAS
jgi:hypothetical protein